MLVAENSTVDAGRLSLKDIEQYDPGGGKGSGRWKRFLCPLPACAEKRATESHRSLSVNMETGGWKCHRCQEHGLLFEFAHDGSSRREIAERIRKANEFTEKDRRYVIYKCRDVVPLEGTPGEDYLRGRGIDPAFATTCNVRFHSDWCGRGAAVIFPSWNEKRVLVAAQGRFLNPPDDLPKSWGVGRFQLGTYGSQDWPNSPIVGVAEAPIDMLSLAQAGLPSICTFGTGIPDAVQKIFQQKRMVIASDNDAGGDGLAKRLREQIGNPYAERLLIPHPFKDPNDWLRGDRRGLEMRIKRLVGIRREGPEIDLSL